MISSVKNFKLIASFILSNQVPTGPNAGGFYYGYEPKTDEKVCRVVVGTTSKTIFTLLELHKFYPDEENYLASAINAGDWLLKMVNLDGEVTPIADCSTGKWQYDDRQSLLYSGQVLSALSRLYAQTGQKLYYDGAKKIADNFVSLVEQRGPLLGDQYRPPNSISSSWVLMSLVDFAKVEPSQIYRSALLEVAETIVSRQIQNFSDVYNHGRYLDAMTTSGNGWLNEVMGDLYNFCMEEEDAEDCQKYYKAMILSSRWLLQNSYTAQNTYNVKNPERAIGGFITNLNSPTVRTDAVCHGINSLLATLLAVGQTKEALVALHERPIQEIIPLLRAGVSASNL